jgi:hypothetical protein
MRIVAEAILINTTRNLVLQLLLYTVMVMMMYYTGEIGVKVTLLTCI